MIDVMGQNVCQLNWSRSDVTLDPEIMFTKIGKVNDYPC